MIKMRAFIGLVPLVLVSGLAYALKAPEPQVDPVQVAAVEREPMAFMFTAPQLIELIAMNELRDEYCGYHPAIMDGPKAYWRLDKDWHVSWYTASPKVKREKRRMERDELTGICDRG